MSFDSSFATYRPLLLNIITIILWNLIRTFHKVSAAMAINFVSISKQTSSKYNKKTWQKVENYFRWGCTMEIWDVKSKSSRAQVKNCNRNDIRGLLHWLGIQDQSCLDLLGDLLALELCTAIHLLHIWYCNYLAPNHNLPCILRITSSTRKTNHLLFLLYIHSQYKMVHYNYEATAIPC